MDPLSITGLTIAVLDKMWKIGEGTAQMVSNFRGFDNDSALLEHKIRDENNRTRALHMLLFEASAVYEGRCLFEQFDVDVRDEIHQFLEQARDVMNQAYQLLDSRQEGSSKIRDTSRDTTPSSMNSLSLSSSYLPSSPCNTAIKGPGSFQKLRWSIRDKKRVETIVHEFSEFNGRIHESIKLWCLGTSIGVNMQHLTRLQDDVNSRALGFDVDARLQIAVSQNQGPSETLEVDDPRLRQAICAAKHINEKFSILDYQELTILIEHRSYAPESPLPVEMDLRTHDLVDKLANLLHYRKEAVFRTPFCRGWVKSMQRNTVALMFSLPGGVEPSPVSLLGVLQSNNMPAPSLSSRFWLALKLARFISQLHLVKWVHESFRSENILFFPRSGDHDNKDCMLPTTQLDLSEPWVLGFEFSRPETYFSSGHGDMCLNRDIYRHPDRQKHPTKMFSKIHDIYALGVVLLEIGLWQPAVSLEKNGFAKVQDPIGIKKHLIKHTEKRLANKMGERYKDLILKCLKGDLEVHDDTKEDLKLQQAFRAQVVEVLQRAAENV